MISFGHNPQGLKFVGENLIINSEHGLKAETK